MNYQEANEKLGSRKGRKLENNTYLERRSEDAIAVRLHSTDVVTFKSNGEISLDSGGWKTVTTKDRMNNVLDSFRVYQASRQWYLYSLTNGRLQDFPRWIFEDGIRLQGDKVIGGKLDNAKAQKATRKLKASIKKYSSAYIEALQAGKVKAPSNGDCFYCLMRVAPQSGDSGNPATLGEAFKDVSHLESHFKESYFVPSLLTRAIEAFPVSKDAMWTLDELWTGEKTGEQKTMEKLGSYGDIGLRQFKKSLERYLYRQFGIAA